MTTWERAKRTVQSCHRLDEATRKQQEERVNSQVCCVAVTNHFNFAWDFRIPMAARAYQIVRTKFEIRIVFKVSQESKSFE